MIRDIILIILFLSFVGIVIFLDVPGVQGVLQLRKEINVQKEALMEDQIFMANVQQLIKLYKENKESVDKIEFILPTEEDIPNLIVQVEALVLEQGLILDKLEVSMPSEEAGGGTINPEDVRLKREAQQVKNYKTLTINLGFIGDYSALKNFLRATEENMRLLDIDSISISPESGEVPGIFKFDLSLRAYYQK